ncbi:hypothetical protein [Haliscomenobacter sp.]|uniref:hypothetical protein n=1 Tax=Haliscomenobacter sp. TaxID=2717303 RepID=UPI003BAC1147
MKKFHNLFIVLFLLAQLSCKKDEIQDPVIFEFVGTYNDQPFSFSGANLGLGKGKEIATNKITYSQTSSFGNPIPISKGIRFDFSFGETNASYGLVKSFVGQSLINKGLNDPSLRILVFNEGEIIYSDEDDECQIEEVRLIKKTEMVASHQTDRIIALKGRLKILSEQTIIKGTFTLKLAEVDY